VPKYDQTEITKLRAKSEARVSSLLAQARSSATLEDIRTVILNDSLSVHPSVYLGKLARMFKTPQNSVDLCLVFPVIQDAWNYFPHRSLEGRCPAELLVVLDIPSSGAAEDAAIDEIHPDTQKIIEAVLAVLLLGLHNQRRVWKTHDFEALDRLYKKGYITDPSTQAMSVALTDSGIAEGERQFAKLFMP
jgi:hypothetical protein